MSNFFKRWSALKSSQTQTERIEPSPVDTPLVNEDLIETETPLDAHSTEQGPSLELSLIHI